jgi:hypothetical protein
MNKSYSARKYRYQDFRVYLNTGRKIKAGRQENLHVQYVIAKDRGMWEDHKWTVKCFEHLNGFVASNS